MDCRQSCGRSRRHGGRQRHNGRQQAPLLQLQQRQHQRSLAVRLVMHSLARPQVLLGCKARTNLIVCSRKISFPPN